MGRKKDDEDMNATQGEPQKTNQAQKAEESFKKLVKANGKALEKLSKL
ncbi:hypothetical protein WMZ97_06525 [Lentibacillus sp. N15]